MTKNTKFTKDALLALSFANLFLLSEWLNFIGHSNHPFTTYEYASHTGSSYWALLMCLFISALGYYFLLSIANRSQSSFIQAMLGFVLTTSLIFPLNAIRLNLTHPENISLDALKRILANLTNLQFYWVLSALAIIAFFLFLKSKWNPLHKLLHSGKLVAQICIPILFITCGNLLWLWFLEKPHSIPTNNHRSEKLNRVVWILFDEWDQRLSFQERPNTLQLPNFEKIKSASVSFDNSYPPGRNTIESVPSLLIGKKTMVERFESDDLILASTDNSDIHWSSVNNIFRIAKTNGNRTGIAGWFHRYCDVFRNDVDVCHRNSRLRFDYSTDFLKNIQLIMTRSLLIRHRHNQIHIDDFDSLLEKSKLLASDKNLDLVFIHLPVPHGPFIYDRIDRKMNPAKVQNPEGYLDNLALADAAMGEIRRSMESNGTWDKTTLILSADHSWRDSAHFDGKHDYRVPLIIKMPDAQKRIITKEYSTILSYHFITSVLQGNLNTTDDASRFLDSTSEEFAPSLKNAPDVILSELHTH